MRKTVLITLLYIVGLLTASAQLEYRVEAAGTASSGDHAPLWLNANKYGLSSVDKTSGYVRAGLFNPLRNDSARLDWGYGVDVAVAGGFTSTLVVQQAYVEGRWLKGRLTLGSKEYPMELKNQQLSSGSQTFGVNARPVPQLRLALPDYWTFANGWLGIKGHIAYGIQTDDHWQQDFVKNDNRYTKHTLLHTKAGYLKIGPKNITVELGVEMACQFGGKSWMLVKGEGHQWVESSQGPSAFLHALIPGGSDVTEDVYKNAEGNQLGSLMARLNLDYPKWNLGLYADHYFEDHSSMYFLGYGGYGEGDQWDQRKKLSFFVYEPRDMMLGAELKLKQFPWLNTVLVEYLYTKYQSGAVYHDHTPYSNVQVSGRDNYYNHHIYTGWQHWGQVMGNPLYRSPLYNADGSIEVKNNRFQAWHLGLEGQPLPTVGYRFLLTYQDGLGTYLTPYVPHQYNLSMMAEATWAFADGWQARAALALDKGRLYGDNQGVQLTIVKSGLLTR